MRFTEGTEKEMIASNVYQYLEKVNNRTAEKGIKRGTRDRYMNDDVE